MDNCRACKSKLEKGLTKCSVCLCPINLFFWEVKHWDTAKRRMMPRVPSITGDPSGIPAAKCPSCNLIMYVGDIECPHCEYELTANEMEVQKEYSRKQMLKGYKLGGIFTIAFIVLFTVLLSI